MNLDDVDRRVLDAIQSGFPLESRPFQAIGESLGLDEDDVLQRVQAMQAGGIIREVGAVFELKRLGYTSTLCAAEVASDSVEAVAAFINSYPEVTHNYLREHAYNVWFTVIARSEAHIGRILDRIRAEQGVTRVISLPQTRLFKIKVHFKTAPAWSEE
jgi:DNA-binding Lrp family transcriptional regulator